MAFLVAGSGCVELFAGQPGDGAQTSQKDPTKLDGDALTEEQAARVSGSYFLRTRFGLVQRVPFIGDTAMWMNTFSLVSIARDSAGFSVSERLCRTALEFESDVFTMEVPDEAAQSLGEITSRIVFRERDGVIGFERPELVTVVGATLGDPANDELPTAGDDPRLVDVEMDGKPGVTTRIHAGPVFSGDIYVVQRSRPAWTGTVGADHSLHGSIVDNIEQSIVGKTNALTPSSFESWNQTNTSQNRVLLLPAPAEASCADLLQNTSHLTF